MNKMNPKDNIKYFTSCGCMLNVKDLKRTRTRRICKKHRGHILKRTRPCLDCKKELLLCKSGIGSLRCDACEEIHLKKLKKIASKKYEDKITAQRRLANKDKPKKVVKSKPPAIIKPEKQPEPKPVYNPIPIRLRGWSFDKRGDYCRTQSKCRKNKIMDCAKCANFFPIFKGVDPGIGLPG